MELEIPDVPVVTGHTHGRSAALRSSASAFVDHLGPVVGKRPVYLQGSAADQRKGRTFSRHYRWGKDLNVEPQQVGKEVGDLTVMIDVDYHVDMPSHLARNFRPLVMYTFQPATAAKADGDYKFCFAADGKVRYSVTGGGEYSHKLWNWKGDSVSASRTILGIPITYSVFSVERRNVDVDHQLVLVSPMKKFWGCWAWLAMCRAPAASLGRLSPVDGEFVRLHVNTTDGIRISTAKVGGYLSADVDVRVDEAIASAALTVNRIEHATVQSKMDFDGKQKEFRGSEILLEYHRRGDPRAARIDVTSAVRSYQWVNEYRDYNPEKPSMVAFMGPLFHGAFVPEKSKNNDLRMVKTRVADLKHRANSLTPILQQVMSEFIALFTHFTGSLRPVDIDEVYRRQGKPSQRRILDLAQHGRRTQNANVMQKGEAYPNLNDPRAITMINGVDKMEYSQFIYALADELKQFEWYAFGKKPKDIAARVVHLCKVAENHVDGTDFSRQDGNVDDLVRYFERCLMLALFPPRFHIVMLKLMKSQTGLRARTKFGVKYDTGPARASGSAETSAFNTVLNTFIAFLGFRFTKVDGAFLQALQAWEKLGLYGGDDGLTPDQDRKAAEKAAVLMGQKLTCDRTLRGDAGVSFLARHYGPDVWYGVEGSEISCADIRRQLAKFHVTVRLSSKITPVVKLREKAFAFALTDKETPVLGEFVSKVLWLFPTPREEYLNLLGIWNSEIDFKDQYPNKHQGWMDDLLLKQIPDFQYGTFKTWIENADQDTILCPPLFAEPAPPNMQVGRAALEGEFVERPATTTTPPVSAPTVETPARRVKKHYRAPRTAPRAQERRTPRTNTHRV